MELLRPIAGPDSHTGRTKDRDCGAVVYAIGASENIFHAAIGSGDAGNTFRGADEKVKQR
jgi:hypothetical protein